MHSAYIKAKSLQLV